MTLPTLASTSTSVTTTTPMAPGNHQFPSKYAAHATNRLLCHHYLISNKGITIKCLKYNPLISNEMIVFLFLRLVKLSSFLGSWSVHPSIHPHIYLFIYKAHFIIATTCEKNLRHLYYTDISNVFSCYSVHNHHWVLSHQIWFTASLGD